MAITAPWSVGLEVNQFKEEAFIGTAATIVSARMNFAIGTNVPPTARQSIIGASEVLIRTFLNRIEDYDGGDVYVKVNWDDAANMNVVISAAVPAATEVSLGIAAGFVRDNDTHAFAETHTQLMEVFLEQSKDN